jgi:CheY-like chemotaxis protein
VIRRSIRGALRFEEAPDGASGLELAARLLPRVIFLDLLLPGIKGDEVLERLSEDPATASIPVVVVTAQELDPDRHRRLSRRASAILQKRDLSIETLAATLERIGPARVPPP